MMDHTIGVDISKSCLDVFRLEDQAAQRFENSAAGFRALREWLGKAPVARIVFEPTGPYHKAFEAALGETFPLVKVNPLQARRFAEAHGTRAKTDAVDAQMLARMGATFGLASQAPCSREARVLKDLHVARTGLIKDRTRLRNRAQTHDIAVLKRQNKVRLAQLDRQIAELDAEIAALIEARRSTARNRDILCSLPGIGPVTAAALLTLLPEIGTLARKQVASLAGLAPVTRQSGQWQGKAFIAGGRKPLRDALYMPALVAMRYNPDLKAKYDALRAAGKPAKVAIVTVMRKLIETANALVKADRFWARKTA
ncbi:IS110 family transposase [Allosediminivita pacifica]|uniref:Transposase n=1 Tax=Allosediminivita pacifica TaxID=1267769 RepID=A0A2T6A2Q0_9RHOB|nr:IS110 family transposase [Allosediminivita pacifica]PTX38097.1 transposase [Allosediminivita pacifica]